MFEGIDHIVIAVEDFDAAVAQYEAIFGQPVGRTGELPDSRLQPGLLRVQRH